MSAEQSAAGDGWYYQFAGETIGPVAPSELRRAAKDGTITPETLVRHGTQGNWAPATHVKGLPLVTEQQAAPPPIRKTEAPSLGALTRLQRLVFVNLALTGLALLLALVALLWSGRETNVGSEGGNGVSASRETTKVRKSSFKKGSPEHVVHQYANATSWQERLRYVKQTKGIREKMAKSYEGKPVGFEYDEIQKCDSADARIGDVVAVNVVRSGLNAFGRTVSETVTYYLERTPKGYVVLWEPSTHWLPMGWNPYRASRPTQPIDFPLVCTLGTSFYATREQIKRTHYSVAVQADTKIGLSATVQAFVVKDSAAGKKVFQLLKDGQLHKMILTIQFRENVDEDCVWITRVVSDKPWVYDKEMARRYTSPILLPPSKMEAKSSELPFEISHLVTRWTADENIRSGKRLVVPEVRFRVTAASAPIQNLKIKVVFLRKREKEIEVLDEEIEYVVSSGEQPLEKGVSRTVISSSGQGYKAIGLGRDSVYLIQQMDVEAVLYYDIGDGYLKFKTLPVTKELAY